MDVCQSCAFIALTDASHQLASNNPKLAHQAVASFRAGTSPSNNRPHHGRTPEDKSCILTVLGTIYLSYKYFFPSTVRVLPPNTLHSDCRKKKGGGGKRYIETRNTAHRWLLTSVFSLASYKGFFPFTISVDSDTLRKHNTRSLHSYQLSSTKILGN